MKSVVITGVSSGIGHAATQRLLERGWRVFGSVRSGDSAARLQAEFGPAFTPLQFDVTQHDAITTAVTQVKNALDGQVLDGLVNNAGVSIVGPLAEMSLDEFRHQFDVNVFGLLDVTQQFLPLLRAAPGDATAPGRIVNISSVSGRIAYPMMGAYAASKHALEAMSDALRRELMLYGIEVCLIEPGTTQTAIIDKVGQQSTRYTGGDYAAAMHTLASMAADRNSSALPVAVVVDAIVDALESRSPKTRYALPRKRLTGWLLPRWMPDRWLDRFAANQLGLVSAAKEKRNNGKD